MEEKEEKKTTTLRGHIYLLTNRANGKRYVGQTVMIDPVERIKHHFYPSRQKVDLVCKAVQKYGPETFTWELLICCWSRFDLNLWERHYIAHYDSLAPNGYNLRIGGTDKCAMSAESRKKLSDSLKGKAKSKLHCQKMSEVRRGFTSEARKRAWTKSIEKFQKEVMAQKIEGGEVHIFSSIEEAARQLKCQPSCITRVCRGKQNRTQHNGYKFWFKGP